MSAILVRVLLFLAVARLVWLDWADLFLAVLGITCEAVGGADNCC